MFPLANVQTAPVSNLLKCISTAKTNDIVLTSYWIYFAHGEILRNIYYIRFITLSLCFRVDNLNNSINLSGL